MSNIPLNGRIAIIDDQLKHAKPLMNVLSKKQLPFTYFSGEMQYLPSEKDNLNDIRVLFLDVNLIDDKEQTVTTLKSSLIPVLKRVISKENYPYIIIYWSRHDHHQKLIEDDIFENDLSDRKPISFMSAVKSDFFNYDGTETDDFKQKIDCLFSKVNKLITTSHAYSYLLQWENIVHKSADKTLQNIFSACQNIKDWDENAKHLINKLGVSYSGSFFNSQNATSQIKSGFNALNIVFNDTLEQSVSTTTVMNPKRLIPSNKVSTSLSSIFDINSKLLLSQDIEQPMSCSGTVIELTNPKIDKDYEDLLDTLLKTLSKKNEGKRSEIIQSWKKIWVNVTPLCDTVQGKVVFHRLIRGLLVKKDFLRYFHTNEAIYTSPSFTYDSNTYSLVLDFREFFTLMSLNKSKNRTTLFRVRQQLLAEIQSRLSRHVNRQGILFLDDK